MDSSILKKDYLLEYLPQILSALSLGDYRVTFHAKLRMSERNISHADIRNCGQSGLAIVQSDGKIKVVGRDIDGAQLTLICVIEDGVLLVTVF